MFAKVDYLRIFSPLPFNHHSICIQKALNITIQGFREAPTRFELVIEVLQTFALPLGYGAL